MIVSAVLVNKVQASKFGNSFVQKNDKKLSTLYTVNSGNCLKNTQTSEEEQKMFDAINEWKNFCHQQILNGKLDVIA